MINKNIIYETYYTLNKNLITNAIKYNSIYYTIILTN